MSTKKDKLWGGRFKEATDTCVERFTASVDFDQRLYVDDIEGSIAHARMLAKVSLITEEESQQITSGLQTIKTEIDDGKFAWSLHDEDVHMNVEARLIQLIGDVGKKLHTGRSRNDQVVTDLRMYLRRQIDRISEAISRAQEVVVYTSQRSVDMVMPGLTHLQTAQPVSFGHHMMAWFEMLQRDFERLHECRKRVNTLPLGAAALAGSGYALDREYIAQQLGFQALCKNSLDAVSDRDFGIEFCSDAALLMVHLSRMCEELILWTSPQFGFVQLPDRFCTGSSIMPQKKNPDVAELIRGKSGRVIGSLMALLTLMKAQPLAYNRDNQEDKVALFDTVDTLLGVLQVFADMLSNIQLQAQAMRAAAVRGYATATDVADYLVVKGMPFRDAHTVVGELVAHAIAKHCELQDLSLAELRNASTLIDEDVYEVLTPEGSIARRDIYGGTAPQQVRARIEEAQQMLAARVRN